MISFRLFFFLILFELKITFNKYFYWKSGLEIYMQIVIENMKFNFFDIVFQRDFLKQVLVVKFHDLEYSADLFLESKVFWQ